MPLEIERKFLIDKTKLQFLECGVLMSQVYLSDDPSRTVRIRIAGEKAFLTIKGLSNGIARKEFEYSIPLEDAREMMELAIYPPVEKTRYKLQINDLIWEIDIFHGANDGLHLAEVELKTKKQKVQLPDWITKEVSGEACYFNSYLAKFPYKTWKK